MTEYDKDYLGDSVYVHHDGYSIVLTTVNDSSRPSNTIYMEPEVLEAFERYIKRIREGVSSD